jgi:hypothetical protein
LAQLAASSQPSSRARRKPLRSGESDQPRGGSEPWAWRFSRHFLRFDGSKTAWIAPEILSREHSSPARIAAATPPESPQEKDIFNVWVLRVALFEGAKKLRRHAEIALREGRHRLRKLARSRRR